MIRFKYILKECYVKFLWRLRNTHNETRLAKYTDISKIAVGNKTYGSLLVFDNCFNSNLRVGNYCSIARNCAFLLGVDHELKYISTFPFNDKVFHTALYESVSKGDILIDDDVWIGFGATILSGVHIGQGAVIAAGAVVVHDVPPYAIVGGVPAKVLKYRFDPDVIDFLQTLDYGSITEKMMKDHSELFSLSLESMNLDEIRMLYSWFPKKQI